MTASTFACRFAALAASAICLLVSFEALDDEDEANEEAEAAADEEADDAAGFGVGACLTATVLFALVCVAPASLGSFACFFVVCRSNFPLCLLSNSACIVARTCVIDTPVSHSFEIFFALGSARSTF